MHFTIDNEALARALTFIQGCIPTTTTMPILEHVFVTADPFGLAIRASDLSREAEIKVAADVATPGALAIPGAVLTALAKKLPKGGQTEFKLGNSDRIQVKAGKVAKYDLRTLPSDLFPRPRTMEEPVVFSIPALVLKEMLAVSITSASPNVPAQYGHGVRLTIEGRHLVTVGCDSHRIARVQVDTPKGAPSMPPITIVYDHVREVMRLLDLSEEVVEVAVSDTQFELRHTTGRYTTALLDLRGYPDYWRPIRSTVEDQGPAVVFRPYVLAEAIQRAQVVYTRMTGEAAKTPTLQVFAKDNILCIETGQRGNDEAREEIECETNGLDYDFGIAAKYASEMLATWPETAVVHMKQIVPGGPILFTSPECPGRIYIIMPAKRLTAPRTE